MLWNIDTLKSSLQSLLGHKGPETSRHAATARSALQLEAIRTAMVAELMRAGPAGFEHLLKRLELARDIEALWFLRADLMAALKALAGDYAAERSMARITPRFRGLLPPSLNSRPSPLA